MKTLPLLPSKQDGSQNSCGECSACCSALAVGSIQKPAFTPCQHLAEPGCCGVYETRPECCKVFECGWLKGKFGGPGDRPDKIGVVFWPQYLGKIKEFVLTATEVWPGALAPGTRGCYVLDKASELTPIVVQRMDESKSDRTKNSMVGDLAKIDKFMAKFGFQLPAIKRQAKNKKPLPQHHKLNRQQRRAQRSSKGKK